MKTDKEVDDGFGPSKCGSQILIAIACLAILVIFVGVATQTCKWDLVSRSGSLIVVLAVLAEGWTILTTPDYGKLSFWGTQAAHTAVRASIVLICFGTVVQGYGDIFFEYLLSCRRT